MIDSQIKIRKSSIVTSESQTPETHQWNKSPLLFVKL
jgi:hypothetical protein